MSIVGHFESHLGQIAGGWSDDEGSGSLQVVRFPGQPVPDVSCYATLGLSEHVLAMPRGREVRQELVFCAYDRFPAGDVASFLMSFGESLVPGHRALLRGDVIGPGEAVIPGSSLNAVYASVPVVFDDSFGTYERSTPATVVVWLIPLSAAEAGFVRQKGWSAFEELLEDADPDLFDLERPSLF